MRSKRRPRSASPPPGSWLQKVHQSVATCDATSLSSLLRAGDPLSGSPGPSEQLLNELLYKAVRSADVSTVKALLEAGAVCHARESAATPTPLHAAAASIRKYFQSYWQYMDIPAGERDKLAVLRRSWRSDAAVVKALDDVSSARFVPILKLLVTHKSSRAALGVCDSKGHTPLEVALRAIGPVGFSHPALRHWSYRQMALTILVTDLMRRNRWGMTVDYFIASKRLFMLLFLLFPLGSWLLSFIQFSHV
jgi:hypothetical protein